MSTNDKIYNRDFASASSESLALVAKHIKNGSRVLDIGCGAGDLGAYLRSEKACHVVGMDYSADSLAVAADKLDASIQIDLNTQRPDEVIDEQFDVIVMADILEHIYAPDAVLASADKLLKTDGKVLISIPNAAYLGALLSLYDDSWDYREEGILDRTHIRFYTKKSVLELLANSGFDAAICDRVTRDLLDSEFTQRFDNQVDSVHDWLLAKPEGATYQFIVEARPTAQQHTLAIEPACPMMSLQHIVKLYWQSDTTAAFSAEQSAVLRGEMGKTSTLRAPVTDSALHSLRIDFADRRGVYWLACVEIFDGKTLLWSTENDSYTLNTEQLFSHQQRLPMTAMAHGEQAYIQLLLPEAQHGETLSITVTLSAPVGEQNTTFLDAVSVNQYNAALHEQQRLASELAKVHKETGAYLGTLETTLQHERTQFTQQQNTINDLNQKLSSLEQALQLMTDSRDSAQQQLNTLHQSSSWKITAPLRKIIRLIK